MHPIIWLLTTVISIYSMIVFIMVIVSLLIHFNILNLHQPFVYRVNEILIRITEPALRPIRRFLPDMGGIDLSPVILLLGLSFLEYTLHYYFSGPTGPMIAY